MCLFVFRFVYLRLEKGKSASSREVSYQECQKELVHVSIDFRQLIFPPTGDYRPPHQINPNTQIHKSPRKKFKNTIFAKKQLQANVYICIDGKQKAIVINQFPSLASPMASITLEPNLGNDIFFQPENDTPDMFEEGMRIMKLYFEPSHFVFQLNGICLACSIYINHYNPLECECVLCVSYFI